MNLHRRGTGIFDYEQLTDYEIISQLLCVPSWAKLNRSETLRSRFGLFSS